MDFLVKVHAQSTEEPVSFQPRRTEKATFHATKPLMYDEIPHFVVDGYFGDQPGR